MKTGDKIANLCFDLVEKALQDSSKGKVRPVFEW